ncbi:MAG: hypothetical protein IPL46_26815 [Saprospiraceae bacterium]|nr:hypothetical protein [Saprospiraceae bacterium]
MNINSQMMKSNRNQEVFKSFIKADSLMRFSVFLLGLFFLQACQNFTEGSTLSEKAGDHPNIIKLKGQSAEFTPEIVKLNENV